MQNAISKYHGGMNAVRVKLGYTLPQRPKGYLKNWRNVETELTKIIKELNRFPMQSELKNNGESSLASAIYKYHGGFDAARSRMGYESKTERLESFLEKYVGEEDG